MSSQDASWDDLGSIWVAKRGPRRGLLGGKLRSKKVRKNDAKKGLVLGGLGGGRTQRGVGNFEPAVIRGRLGCISPLALIVFMRFVCYPFAARPSCLVGPCLRCCLPGLGLLCLLFFSCLVPVLVLVLSLSCLLLFPCLVLSCLFSCRALSCLVLSFLLSSFLGLLVVPLGALVVPLGAS